MRGKPELRPNGWDAVVAGVVILLALLSAGRVWGGASGGALTAVISVDGVQTEMVELDGLREPEERTLTANGFTLHLVLDREGARMASSDCPTQDCVHTGTITRPGQSIVCLPARVSVQLVGTDGGDGLDAVIG